jgi:hypothetical protein
MGDTPPLLQPFPSQTRKPVMAMYQIISKPVLLPEIFQFVGEITKMIIDGQFLYLFFSCLEMDKSRILP